MNYNTNNDGISQIGNPLEDAIQDELATRTEVPAPSTLPDYFAPRPMPQVTFADRLSARSDYELGRMAGRDEIRAEQEERKKNGVWVEHAGHCNAVPQGEPSDAVIVDMLSAFYDEERDGWSMGKVRRMRAALRAAGEVTR